MRVFVDPGRGCAFVFESRDDLQGHIDRLIAMRDEGNLVLWAMPPDMSDETMREVTGGFPHTVDGHVEWTEPPPARAPVWEGNPARRRQNNFESDFADHPQEETGTSR